MKLRIPVLAAVWLCAFLLPVWGQHQNDKWFMGYHAAVDFSSGVPAQMAGSMIYSVEGSASVADPVTGDLLFYTNGIDVWNALHQIMPNGSGLLGDLSSTTGALIVPKPFTPGIYYLFSVDAVAMSGDNGVTYSVVDMSLNGGLGDIVAGQKNIPLLAVSDEKLTAVPTADGCGFWIVGHTAVNNTYYSWKLMQTGLITTPVISSFGQNYFSIMGYLKVNAQYNKIALAAAGPFGREVELLDFNRTTGVLSNPVILPLPNTLISADAYGVEFSPNGSRLYVTGNGSLLCYQYDLLAGSTAAIAASVTVLNPPSQITVGAIQRGPDGKLYLPNWSGNLDVIPFPDMLGAACGYTSNAIVFPLGSSVTNGLPMEVIFPPEQQHTILVTDSCTTSLINFSLDNTNGIQSVFWDFGDPASGAANTSSSLTPQKIYNAAGVYTITAMITNACATYTLAHTLTVTDCPTTIEVGDTCALSVPFHLHGSIFPFISWNFGDPASGAGNTFVTTNQTDPVHTFSGPGVYTVTAIYQKAGSPVDTLTRTISVGIPGLGAIQVSGNCQGSPLSFSISGSANLQAVTWNFGDPASGAGNSSASFTPQKAYTTAGVYTVTAVVVGANGCMDTLTHVVPVFNCGAPTPVSVQVLDTCKLKVPFQVSAPGYFPYMSWNFGDPASGASNTFVTTTQASPSHTFSAPGLYTVTFTYQEGGFTPVTLTLTVSVARWGGGTLSSTGACVLLPLAFGVQGYESTLNSILWNFSDPASGSNNTATSLSPTHTFSSPGFYLVTAEMHFTCGVQTLTRIVNVKAPDAPETGFSYPSPICQLAANPLPVLTPGFQSGGFFTASGGLSVDSLTGLVNLGSSGAGQYLITYQVAAVPAACKAAGSRTAPLEIVQPGPPVVGFSYASPACIFGGDPVPVLASGFTSGGTFMASGGLGIDAQTGVVDLAASLPGAYVISYQVGNSPDACLTAGQGTTPLEIVPAVPAVTAFTYASPVCAHAGNLVPALGSNFSAGGTFSSAAGLGLNPATGMVTPTASTPGTYTVTYVVAPSVAACRLGGTGNATLAIEPTTYPVTDFTYPTPLCSDATDVLPVPVSGFTPGGIFSSTAGLTLDPVSGEIKISSSVSGNYTISYATLEEGCRVTGSSRASLEIIPIFEPVTDFTYPDPLCAVRSAVNPVFAPGFSQGGIFSGSAGLEVEGATGSIDLVRTPPGAYTVLYNAASLLCARGDGVGETVVVIEPVEIPVTEFAYPDVLSCEDTLFLPELAPGFSPEGVFSSDNRLAINPVTGEINREESSLKTHTIYYEVAGEGCRVPRGSSFEVLIPDCTCRIFLPNAFSPNDDDANRVYAPVLTCAVEAYTLTVFDRWGKEVFRSAETTQGWEGTVRGEPAPEGVYVVTIEGVFPNGQPVREMTTVVLMR